MNGAKTKLTSAHLRDKRQDLLCLPSWPCPRKEHGRHSCQAKHIQVSTCREAAGSASLKICLQKSLEKIVTNKPGSPGQHSLSQTHKKKPANTMSKDIKIDRDDIILDTYLTLPITQ